MYQVLIFLVIFSVEIQFYLSFWAAWLHLHFEQGTVLASGKGIQMKKVIQDTTYVWLDATMHF